MNESKLDHSTALEGTLTGRSIFCRHGVILLDNRSEYMNLVKDLPVTRFIFLKTSTFPKVSQTLDFTNQK